VLPANFNHWFGRGVEWNSDFPKCTARAAVISLPRETPFLATIRVHEGASIRGGASCEHREYGSQLDRSARTSKSNAFTFELASFNDRIQELEKQHPEASKIEALRASALVLARQIDEIRCSSANDLTDLLAK
jgi:hypothetical protein